MLIRCSSNVDQPILRCDDLGKFCRGSHWAIRKCDFAVTPSGRAAIIGANGAGKTTLLNLILGTIAPTCGAVYWFGQPTAEVLPELYESVAFVPEVHVYTPKWTGEQIIAFVQSFYKNWNSNKESFLRKLLVLPLTQKTQTYSKGNLARLSLLLALSQGASVFIMDEPFSGLDPLMRDEILSLVVKELDNYGSTLILTSHDLFAVELLAKELWVLHDGSFIFCGKVTEFLTSYQTFNLDTTGDFQAVTFPIPVFVHEFPSQDGIRQIQVTFKASRTPPLIHWLNQNNLRFTESSTTLRDAYAACVSDHVKDQAKR